MFSNAAWLNVSVNDVMLVIGEKCVLKSMGEREVYRDGDHILMIILKQTRC